MNTVVNFGEITVGKKLGGSTGAYVATWLNKPYVYKPGARGAEAHAMNEILALRLFAAAGVRVPEEIYEVRDGAVFNGLLISYIPGASARELFDDGVTPPGSPELQTLVEAVERDFVIHALFANWDARNAENYMVKRSDEGVWDLEAPFVIDLGGALMYRAMGAFDPRKMPADGLEGGRGNIQTLAEFATAGRYFSRFKDGTARHTAVCQRWAAVDKAAILNTLDANAHLAVDPRGRPIHEELMGRLEGRMAAIDAFCAQGGGGRNKKMTRRRRVTKHTTKHRSRRRL